MPEPTPTSSPLSRRDAPRRSPDSVLSPGTNESAGKRLSGRTRQANRTLRAALVESAGAAVCKRDCYLAAQYRRLVKRRGDKRAIVAVAHSILIIAYHVLCDGQSYRELGGDYFDRMTTDRACCVMRNSTRFP